jgi:hypothetical protein
MPKEMPISELLAKLQRERDEIDAALRQLTRVGYQDFPQSPVVKAKKSHHKQMPAPAPAPAKKKHIFTAAEKANLSRKVRAYWKKRKAAEAKG